MDPDVIRALLQGRQGMTAPPPQQLGGIMGAMPDQPEATPAGGVGDVFERGINAIRRGRTSDPKSFSQQPQAVPPQQAPAPQQQAPQSQPSREGYRVDLPQFFKEPFTLPNQSVNDFFKWFGYEPESPSARGYNPADMPEDNGGNAYIKKNPHGPQYGGWVVHDFKDMGSPNQINDRDWAKHGFKLWMSDHSGKVYQDKEGRRFSIDREGHGRFYEPFGKGPGHWQTRSEQ